MLLFSFFGALFSFSAAECPDSSWFSIGKHCYHISMYQLDWGNSTEVILKSLKLFHIFCLQYCRNAGGYLAEFESLEEEQAIDSILWFIASSYWIGLSDLAQKGTWRWQQSSEEPSYLNWGTGQPNDIHGDEDCCMKQCSTGKRWKKIQKRLGLLHNSIKKHWKWFGKNTISAK